MATAYGYLFGTYPAIIKSYDQARRTCRIEIPGITSGGDVLPEAEILYPIGDKSRQGQYETELEIVGSETVWVQFIGGDPRYPIIIGNRNPQTGNSADWRRYHHKNYENLTDIMMHFESGETIQSDAGINIDAYAGESMVDDAGKTIYRHAGESITDEAGQSITIKAGQSITLEAGSNITLKVGGSTISISGGSVSVTSGAIALNGPITGGGAGGAKATFNGPIEAKQTITADDDVVAGGVSLMRHIHQIPTGSTDIPT